VSEVWLLPRPRMQTTKLWALQRECILWRSMCTRRLEDWAKHKLACVNLGREHSEAFAAHEARGGRKRDFRKNNRYLESWFQGVLFNQIGLLA
jgi:hypothetical protein